MSKGVWETERLGYRKGASTSSDCGLSYRAGLAACLANGDGYGYTQHINVRACRDSGTVP